MKKFIEFTCLFDDGEDLVTGEPNFSTGTISVDMMNVIAFNPFMLEGYTVLRMNEGTSFVVKASYDEIKDCFSIVHLYDYHLS